MIVIDSAERTDAEFAATILVAGQLAAAGHRVAVDEAGMPHPAAATLIYEAAPFLTEISGENISRVVLLASGPPKPPTLSTLRSYRLPPEVAVTVLGRFATRQSELDALLPVAYALGRDPDLVNLAEWQKRPLGKAGIVPISGFPVAPRAHCSPEITRVTIVLGPDALADPAAVQALAVLAYQPRIRLCLVVPADQKARLEAAVFGPAMIVGPSEVLPAALVGLSDIIVIFDLAFAVLRIAALCTDALQSGVIVVDSTAKAEIVSAGAPALRGPTFPGALWPYLDGTVLSNRDGIARQVAKSAWLAAWSFDRVAAALTLPPRPVARTEPATEVMPRTVFLPTNGVGLGHAQRCLQIAAAMKSARVGFAAFPSCLPMIEASGLPCIPLVQRSNDHPDRSGNDVLNGLRLQRSLRAGDTLVFDGGYVFPSVYRSILELGLVGVWIRRGLWQPGQITPQALQRESVFQSVIVPGEAFEELNDRYSFGPRITPVGPIVKDAARSKADRRALRARLAKQFGMPVSELVVTMLGGGVAADRVAQTTTVCSAVEGRTGCLNLIVLWPGSRVSPALQGWKNSVVVQTRHAADLCLSADLVVSAAGYNSFHECLYNAVPAIFVPQMAPYMDDQDRRARAACDRDVAAMVSPDGLLDLDREIGLFLDAGKGDDLRRNLARLDLPERGTAEAAALIKGLTR
jgi:hypothetical protein